MVAATQHVGRPPNDNLAAHPYDHLPPKHQRDSEHKEDCSGAPFRQHDGTYKDENLDDAAAGGHLNPVTGPRSKHAAQRYAQRNWYRKCLALCATAENLGSEGGAPLVTAALREASSAERLEASWICMANAPEPHAKATARMRKQLWAPLLIGRGPQSLLFSLQRPSVPAESQPPGGGQTWKILYGGLLRTPGGLGVSRLQKDVIGTGLRFKPNEVIRVQALKESELYVGKQAFSDHCF